MSYPPPPGLASSSTPQPPPGLPARPPPSVSSAGGFSAFKPRSVTTTAAAVAAAPQWRTQSPTIVGAPAPPSGFSFSQTQQYASAPRPLPQTSQYNYPQSDFYQRQPQQQDLYTQPAAPQIRNPFPLPGQASSSSSYGGAGGAIGREGNSSFDPEMEAQIAQWQSAYAARDEDSTTVRKTFGLTGPSSAGGANAVALGTRPNNTVNLTSREIASVARADTGVAAVVAGPDGNQKTVVRSGGGESWQDSSLLEWDPAHFRIFVGNLAGEVTDESLLKAFSKYGSVQKARVVRDKRTTKSKGYGFVSFSDGDEYFQAAKDMQGKYIGSHPVLIKRSTTEIKAVNPIDKRKHGKGAKLSGSGGGGTVGNAQTGAGVQKKQSKTKGGLRLLG